MIPKKLFPVSARFHVVPKVVDPSQPLKAQRLRMRTIELKMSLGPPLMNGVSFLSEEPDGDLVVAAGLAGSVVPAGLAGSVVPAGLGGSVVPAGSVTVGPG